LKRLPDDYIFRTFISPNDLKLNIHAFDINEYAVTLQKAIVPVPQKSRLCQLTRILNGSLILPYLQTHEIHLNGNFQEISSSFNHSIRYFPFQPLRLSQYLLRLAQLRAIISKMLEMFEDNELKRNALYELLIQLTRVNNPIVLKYLQIHVNRIMMYDYVPEETSYEMDNERLDTLCCEYQTFESSFVFTEHPVSEHFRVGDDYEFPVGNWDLIHSLSKISYMEQDEEKFANLNCLVLEQLSDLDQKTYEDNHYDNRNYNRWCLQFERMSQYELLNYLQNEDFNNEFAQTYTNSFFLNCDYWWNQ